MLGPWSGGLSIGIILRPLRMILLKKLGTRNELRLLPIRLLRGVGSYNSPQRKLMHGPNTSAEKLCLNEPTLFLGG